MMAVAINADEYANPRQNIFFSGVTPDLDGQCVSLVKWFLQEMTSVPNPQAARGDARYVGKALVAQGHAVEVPFADRRRGDIVTYEYGVYGHIGVILSGNRTFEENVNWPGVASKIVDGARVYASRIGSIGETWRHDMHIYRIKSYNEGEVMATIQRGDVDAIWATFFPKPPLEEDYAYAVGKTWEEYIKAVLSDPRMHPQKEDVDRMWTKWVDKAPAQEDYDFGLRASWSAYINSLLEFPPTISVQQLHDAQAAAGSGDPDEHALAEAVRKVANK